jgi:hypothetical protein
MWDRLLEKVNGDDSRAVGVIREYQHATFAQVTGELAPTATSRGPSRDEFPTSRSLRRLRRHCVGGIG